MATLEDYQKAFAERSSRMHAYLVRCAIVIGLLFVVVEDRLYTAANRTNEVQAIIARHDRELGAAASALRRHHARLRHAFEKIREEIPVKEEVDDLVQRLTPVPASLESSDEKDIFDKVVTLSTQIGADVKSSAERLEAARSTPVSNTVATAAADDTARERRELQQRIENLVDLRRLLADYPAVYRLHSRAWTHANDEKTARLKELADLQRQSASVPTPFGGFDVLPGLALIGLAVGAFICLVNFYVNAFRLQTLTRDAANEHGSNVTITTAGSAPFWLATFDRSLDATFRWKHPWPRVAGSALLQAVWLGAIIFLTSQCLRWRAAQTVLFVGSATTTLLLYAFMTAAGLVAVWYFMAPEGQTNPPNGRRRALRAVGVFVGCAAYVGVVGAGFGWWRRTRAARRNRYVVTGDAVGATAGAFVVNRRTGVMHHQRGCAKHLPAVVNQAAVAPSDPDNRSYCLHRAGPALALVIRQRLSLDAIEKPQFSADKCFELVKLALDQSPHNIRLHDFAVRRFGTLKRYDLIDQLFVDANVRIQRALAASPEARQWLATRYEMEQRRKALEKRRT